MLRRIVFVSLFAFLFSYSPITAAENEEYICDIFSESGDLRKAIDAYNSRQWDSALALATKCGNGGSAQAQFMAGVIYFDGRGKVQKNISLAISWWERAANAGNYSAAMNLGTALARGQGTIRDRARAHMWWNMMASKDVEDAAKYRDQLEKLMSPVELEEAIRLARKCLADKLMIMENVWFGPKC